MKAEIKIPSVGESISEVTIASILKPAGSFVKENEEIIELETEKVNQVLYAPSSGMIEWTVKEGDSVAIGTVIGQIDTEKQGEKPSPKKEEQKAPEIPKEEKKEIPKEAKEIPKEAKEVPKEAKEVPKEKPESPEEKIRLTKEDFVAELKKEEPTAPAKEKILPKKIEGREIRRKMTKIRKTIGSRLVEALHQAAMLTTFNEVDMNAIMDLRNKYKESFQKKYGVKLGFMSFFVKAVVEALKAFPDFNSYLDKDEIVQRQYYDIGIAVGTERGLVVPVIRDCDRLSFAEIEKKIESFAKKAREGKLTIEDLQGGGFTITNGGVYGSLLSTPILNPPQVGILGMHKILNRPIAQDGQVLVRPMMYLALSYDHRIVDGKEAVTFLIRIKEYLEDPSRLILFETDGTV